MNEERQKLLIAVEARLERCAHEIGHAAVEWLEVSAAEAATSKLRESFRTRALGEAWRRERLRALAVEIKAGIGEVREQTVLFLALDTVDPPNVPSFVEWMAARA